MQNNNVLIWYQWRHDEEKKYRYVSHIIQVFNHKVSVRQSPYFQSTKQVKQGTGILLCNSGFTLTSDDPPVVAEVPVSAHGECFQGYRLFGNSDLLLSLKVLQKKKEKIWLEIRQLIQLGTVYFYSVGNILQSFPDFCNIPGTFTVNLDAQRYIKSFFLKQVRYVTSQCLS